MPRRRYSMCDSTKSSKANPEAFPEVYVNRVLRGDCSITPGSQLRDSARLEPILSVSSPTVPEETEGASHTIACYAADKRNDRGLDVPIQKCEEDRMPCQRCSTHDSIKSDPTACPEMHANHTLYSDCSTPVGSRPSSFTCSESTLFAPTPNEPVEETPVPYKSTSGPAGDRDDRDLALPVWDGTRDHSTHNNTTPIYLGRKHKNVVLFGETGAGKSSVINLLAGENVADTSPNLVACTLQATQYWFSLPKGVSFRIFDTVGLEEPEIGVNTFMGTIEKAHQLVTSLHSSGGIDLLLFCIRGGRLTSAMQRSYRLFFEVLCGKQVPLAIVITNLEQEDIMEDWWVKNEQTFHRYGVYPVAHACITAVPAHLTMYQQKRVKSQEVLQKMLRDTLIDTKPPYLLDTRNWFISIIQLLRSFVVTRKNESLKKKALVKKLERRCALSRKDAEKLAQMLVQGNR